MQEAKRLARPGGTIALQEADIATLNRYPSHPSWDKLKAALFGAFSAVGADVELARRLYFIVRQADWSMSNFDHSLLVCGQWIHWSTIYRRLLSSYAQPCLKLGLLSELELPVLLAQCREHLGQADTVFTTYTVAQVWGQKA